MWQVGATLHRGAQAFHCRGLSCCRAQPPDAQAQQLWLTGLVAPRHVGSSQTRARTRVSCISRQILNHCATREALEIILNVAGDSVATKANLDSKPVEIIPTLVFFLLKFPLCLNSCTVFFQKSWKYTFNILIIN